MNIQKIGASVNDAVAALKNGGVIAYPTEAVYGLGCDPQNTSAIKRILAIKQRASKKGLILIASRLQQLTPYLQELDQETLDRITPSWPGPVTWLLPAKTHVSELLTGDHNTLAVRITAHPLAKKLCEQWDSALVSTSANISSEPAATTGVQVQSAFPDQLDYILDGAVGEQTKPTQIRDGHTGEIIRN